MSLTLVDKLWNMHEVQRLSERRSLLYIDRIFLHERTGSVALRELEAKQRKVRLPSHAFCTMDHIVDTTPGRSDRTLMPSGQDFIVATRSAAQEASIRLFDIDDPDQGIVHVLSPELGIALPGSTLICPDSHTCTLGGVGALAWGVGSTETEHALATSTLRVERPKNYRVSLDGKLPVGVTAKDLILYVIRELSASGGQGYAIEFAGSAVESLPVEGRLTLCNMATELSAFTGIIAPDQKVYDYFRDRDFAPSGRTWELAQAHWQDLKSDPDAVFDREMALDVSQIGPQISWGTSPQHTIDATGVIPTPADAPSALQHSSWAKAQAYMQIKPGTRLEDYPIDAAFLGSCTNSRLSDLRLAADYLRHSGARVAPSVKALCVPGSGRVKRAAEAEGIDEVFREAGFEWREPGCSLCFFAGGERFASGARVISTTNRNFEGRQGLGVRTHLASPLSVVASACAGHLTSVESQS
jgi:3-isopropylmalate/(R)-2-methylmalate dehydratase large subunit